MFKYNLLFRFLMETTYEASLANCKELSLQERLWEATTQDLQRYVEHFEQRYDSFVGRLRLTFNGEYQKASKLLKVKREELEKSLECLGF